MLFSLRPQYSLLFLRQMLGIIFYKKTGPYHKRKCHALIYTVLVPRKRSIEASIVIH